MVTCLCTRIGQQPFVSNTFVCGCLFAYPPALTKMKILSLWSLCLQNLHLQTFFTHVQDHTSELTLVILKLELGWQVGQGMAGICILPQGVGSFVAVATLDAVAIHTFELQTETSSLLAPNVSVTMRSQWNRKDELPDGITIVSPNVSVWSLRQPDSLASGIHDTSFESSVLFGKRSCAGSLRCGIEMVPVCLHACRCREASESCSIFVVKCPQATSKWGSCTPEWLPQKISQVSSAARCQRSAERWCGLTSCKLVVAVFGRWILKVVIFEIDTLFAAKPV